MRKHCPILIVLALCCLLTGCSGPRDSVDLAELFPNAVLGPITAPEGELGRPPAAAFLQGDWSQSRHKSERILAARPGILRFYLSEVLDLTIRLEGHAGKVGKGTISINGHSLGEHDIAGPWQSHDFSIPKSSLQLGENRLRLDYSTSTAWRKFEVKPAASGQGLNKNHEVGSYARSGEPSAISLSFAGSIAYPLDLGPGSKLVIDKVEPWTEAGAPSLESEWGLTVRLYSDNPHLEESWDLKGAGPHTVVLPTTTEGGQAVRLSLFAHASETPLPGQLGLTLTAPRVEFPRKTTPSSTPSPPKAQPTPDSTKRPNVVIYMVDTLRPDRLSTYGHDQPTSPHLDQLAKDGIVFERVIAEAPWTKPTTATVLSGLPALTHAVHDFADVLPQKVETLAETFAAAGYQTGGFFTNPMASPVFGFEQGFQTVKFEKQRVSGLVHRDWVLPWLKHLKKDRPFFLYIHTIDPHLPYTAPKEFQQKWCPELPHGVENEDIGRLTREGIESFSVDREDWPTPGGVAGVKKSYDAEVAANDHSFGALVTALKAQGLYDNTLIVFISDHGEEFYEHRGFGHVHSMYQELLNVPWVMKLPQQEGAGSRVQKVWRQIDMAPTILAHAGLAVPARMPGRVYQPGTPEPPSPPAFTYVHTGRDAVVTQQAQHPFLLHAEGIRLGDFQLIITHAQLVCRLTPVELYDLANDPEQRRNLAPEKPATVLHMRKLLNGVKALYDKGDTAETAPKGVVEDSLRSLQYLQ